MDICFLNSNGLKNRSLTAKNGDDFTNLKFFMFILWIK